MFRILIVDDEPQIAHALRRLFKREGFEVELACSGAEGLERLAAFTPDAVLSDFRMPGMNGAQFLAQVKQRAPLSCRLMLSGYADLEAVTASVNEGEICRFMSKPWRDEELVREVRGQLAQRELMAQLFRALDEPEARPELLRRETCVEVRLQTAAGAAFSPVQAQELVRMLRGALAAQSLEVVAGLLERHGGVVTLTAQIGGAANLVLEVPHADRTKEAS